MIFKVGFGHEVPSTPALVVPRRQTRSSVDEEGTAYEAFAFMGGANVDIEIVFLGEGFGAACISAGYLLPLLKGYTGMLIFNVFLQLSLARAFALTKVAVGV